MVNNVADIYIPTGHPRSRTPEVLPPSLPPLMSPPRECPPTEYAAVTPPLSTLTDALT
ncbi:hypothetical protein K469DRAFT_707574 [Zopfia rhizophila CBS 207.26]|uniref:Uncharacterized protein n=1 Tax=Zopfia rhizophila CBS 207.26 TaxID=1314779 RepID=A0A6A6E403_9PEZI|nr:hypothetical protein K469DRAFT_707574 [Zopfia rhizophila CBS 207.26]